MRSGVVKNGAGGARSNYYMLRLDICGANWILNPDDNSEMLIKSSMMMFSERKIIICIELTETLWRLCRKQKRECKKRMRSK